MGDLPVLLPEYVSNSMMIGSHSYSSYGFQAVVGNSNFLGSTAWGTVNLIIFVPILIERPCRVYQLSVQNGATLGGTTNVGIYNEDGVLLVSAGAAQAGVSAIQTFDIADTDLMPGTYFLALQNTTATATFGAATSHANRGRLNGLRQQVAGAGSLPNPAVFAAFAQIFVPLIVAHLNPTV